MAPFKDELLIGATLGSFYITRVIGQGGMGTVYLGEHKVIGSRVAIKVLMKELARDESLIARFYAEARAVNLIGHENLVNIFDMNVVPPSTYYLVMEYLEGHPLNYLLTEAVPPKIAIPILMQVCDALQAVHDAGVIHRDLKPENIFLIDRGKTKNFVKVLDFGLAKLLDNSRAAGLTAAGLIVGTPEFMSPEQSNSSPVDGRSDIYSLGCIAWLLATGRLPFPQLGLTNLLVAHRSEKPKPPREVNANVQRSLSDTIMKAMEKDPILRFQTAREFEKALEASLKELGASAPVFTKSTFSLQTRETPQQRYIARFKAHVALLDGEILGELDCTDISLGGMFLSANAAYPAVFSRLKIVIPSAKNLCLLGEVVRHVPVEQAKAWGIPAGFGVQFVELTPPLHDALASLVDALPVQKSSEQPAQAIHSVESTIQHYKDRINGDHYVVVDASPEDEIAAIRQKGEIEIHDLTKLKTQATQSQCVQLEAAIVQVRIALSVLGEVEPRAQYDANRGNYRGVAQCIVAGLSPSALDRLRKAFLAKRPSIAGSAHIKYLVSKAYEARNQLKEALEACDAALILDPLNLQLHQHHAELEKRVNT